MIKLLRTIPLALTLLAPPAASAQYLNYGYDQPSSDMEYLVDYLRERDRMHQQERALQRCLARCTDIACALCY